MSHVIGIDGGTESLRAFVFDLAGHPVASCATPYSTTFPEPGWAEQDPSDWWSALGASVSGVMAQAGLSTKDVLALCVDTTCCSVVALDAAGKALCPAMIWMDVRAAVEADAIAESGDPALRINSAGAGPVSAEWMLPKALWLKRNRPDVFAAAAKVGEYQDYLNFHLTGVWAASLNNMAVRWHHQPDHGGLPGSLMEAVGLGDLAGKWPQRICTPGEVIEGLTDAAARHLGLKPGIPVVQGGADAFIAMIGMGVLQAGEMSLITGSSHLQLGVCDREIHGPGIWGTYSNAVYPGKCIIEGGQTSTGSVVNWFKRNFAEKIGFDELNKAAQALPPGAEGLLVLDHFQGNRTPYTDPFSRGAITGLSLKHEPAHIFRAIIEGICMGTRLIVDNFGEAFQIRRLVVAGGATNSPLWLRIHADTLGVPLELTEVPDAPALGCAVLAAFGAGEYKNVEAGIDAMVRVSDTIEPNPANTAAYDGIFNRYRELYSAMKAVREVSQ